MVEYEIRIRQQGETGRMEIAKSPETSVAMAVSLLHRASGMMVSALIEEHDKHLKDAGIDDVAKIEPPARRRIIVPGGRV